MDESSKFTYLRSQRKDEALKSIEVLSLTASNYNTAITLLQERYGRSEKIVFSHINKLLSLEFPTNVTVTELWGVYDKLKGHIRSLESLDIKGESMGFY